MNRQPINPAVSSVSQMRIRCESLGSPMIHCDVNGALIDDDSNLTGTDQTLRSILCSGPMASRLKDLVAQWNDADVPQPARIADGLVAIPLPENDRRRRRDGYLVTYLRTSPNTTREQLQLFAQATGLDRSAIESALGRVVLHSSESIPSVAALLHWMHDDAVELDGKTNALAEFSDQLSENYEEITLLYKLGRFMTELAAPDRFVEQTCDELHATLSYRWVGAGFVADHQFGRHMAGKIVLRTDSGDGEPAARDAIRYALDHVEPAGPLVIPSDRMASGAGISDPCDLIVGSILREEHVVGVFVAGAKQPESASITSADLKLIDAAAGSTGVYLENACLYDDQQAMFLGTLQALTAAIDAKDCYTCGHSERVAHLAVQLALEIGMNAEVAERVRISGLVHDIGKIGVPEAVLSKPGRLTDDEYNIIKRHPEIGVRILRDIPQLADVLPGVLHHHERWDGRGYPSGVAGEDIPLFARLLTLADSFDAMSSTRTYRSAMPRPTVLDEIRKGAGSQFDPDLAPVFVRLDFSVFDQLVRQHSQRELHGAQAKGTAA